MKDSIPLLCLLVICFPGKILGNPALVLPLHVPEPVEDVISATYPSDCNFKAFPAGIKNNLEYSIKIARRVKAELFDGTKKQYQVLTPMCMLDSYLASSVENLLKVICNGTSPQLEIATKVIEKTCYNLIPKVVDGWRKGLIVKVNYEVVYA